MTITQIHFSVKKGDTGYDTTQKLYSWWSYDDDGDNDEAATTTATSISIISGSSELTDDAYQPNPIEVSIDDTVTWTNDDIAPHTVTSGENGEQNNQFDSGIMSTGATFEHTFTETGEFPYFFSPDELGSLIATYATIAAIAATTTTAVTGIIDRLEEAGYVRRGNDPKDRRRTIVEPVRNKKLEGKIEAIFIPFHERMYKLLSSYSDSELTFLLDVLTKSIELTREESKN